MSKTIILCFAIIFSFLAQGSSNHIIAGFSNYKHISESSYEVKFTLIRDQNSGGAELDNEIVVQIYTYDGLAYLFEGNILVERDAIYDFDHGELNSFANSVAIELEYGEFIMEYELTEPDKDYLFVFQRCCRSPLTTNISNSNDNGITLSTTISS